MSFAASSSSTAAQGTDPEEPSADLQSMTEVEVRTAAGLYLGHVTTYHADLRRIDAVMQRTVLGLYWHETGARLPDTGTAVVYSAAGLPDFGAEQQAALQRIVRFAVSGRIRVIARNVFTYALQGIPDAPHGSVWVLLFYDRAAFIGFTGRQEDFG